MVKTKDFSTRTNFIERKNASTADAWGVALDIGYSAVKGMSPNMVFCFPSFARKIAGAMIAVGEPGPDDIQYKDENGDIWNVGSMAQSMISSNDSNDSIQSLYGRNRYFSPMFKVLALTGLGIGMTNNEFGKVASKEIRVQTGLPPAYLRSDAVYLKEVLAGHHTFELRVGNAPWKQYDFTLEEDNIRVMAQPMGSFLSAFKTNTADWVPEINAHMAAKTLVFDAGFGTVDTYAIHNRQIIASESYDNCGMKAVFMDLTEKVYQKYHTEIPVHALQGNLKDGYIKTFDRRAMKTTNVKFDDLLEKSNKKVCMDAIEQIKQRYNNLLDYDYLLVTGGTGAAWLDIITEHFAGMEGLKIITGNQNDTLSHIYSNVRGYYLHQVSQLKKAAKNS